MKPLSPSARSSTFMGMLVVVSAALLACKLGRGEEKKAESDTTARTVRPPPEVTTSACKATSDHIGDWRPSVEEVVTAARSMKQETCVPAERIAGLLSSCAKQVHTSTVSADIQEPGYTACSHSVRVATWNERRFVKISATVGRGATFFGLESILEVKNGAAEPYFEGDLGSSSLCGGGGADQTSPRMTADWPSIPQELKDGFFCGNGKRNAKPPADAADEEQKKALEFFLAKVAECRSAASHGPGSKVVETRPDRTVKVKDGFGQTMLVHRSAGQIYGPRGPQGVMPQPYVHCSHKVFVGTMDH